MVSMSILLGYQWPMFLMHMAKARPTTMLTLLSKPGPERRPGVDVQLFGYGTIHDE